MKESVLNSPANKNAIINKISFILKIKNFKKIKKNFKKDVGKKIINTIKNLNLNFSKDFYDSV